MKRLSLLLLILAGMLFAQSEEELIQAALKHSFGIRLRRIDVEQDSIRLVKRYDELKPTLKLSLNGDLTPYDSSINEPGPGTEKSGFNGLTQAVVSKNFAGGGRVSASALAQGYAGIDPDSTKGSSDLSLSFTQPLLKNGLKNSYHRFMVQYEGFALAEERLRYETKIIEALSEVRSTLLALETKEKYIETIRQRKKQAERKHAENLKRLAAGMLGHIDTLHSQLTQIRVEQDLFRAESELHQSRSYLAYLCGVSIEGTVTLAKSEFRFPDKTLLLTKAMAHPDITILDILDSSLAVSIRQQEQYKRPELDARLSLSRIGRGDHLFDEDYSRRKVTLGIQGQFSLPFHNIKHEISLLKRSRERQSLQKGERKAFLTYEIDRLELLWKRERALLDLRVREKEVSVALFEALQKASDAGAVSRSEYYTAEEDAYNATLAVDSQELLLRTISVSLEKITGEVLQRYGVKL